MEQVSKTRFRCKIVTSNNSNGQQLRRLPFHSVHLLAFLATLAYNLLVKMNPSMKQALHRTVPLTYIIPPYLAYNAHKNYDSREILEGEVNYSRSMLAHLSPFQYGVESAAKSKMNKQKERRGDCRDHHLKNLIESKSGVTLLPHLLDDSQLKIWKDDLYKAINNKEGKNHIRNNRGRLHSHQESSKDPYHNQFIKLVSTLPELQDLVESYFLQHTIDRYKLTQIQFLLAKPGSTHQIWHRDNIAPGLTLLIALDDVNGNGPTELLLGSHSAEYSVFNKEDQIILGCLSAGDAILYDSRVIHRGRGFNQGYENRPVLILRWDALSTPPPGAGFIVTNYIDWLGLFKTIVNEAQELVQSSFGIDTRIHDKERQNSNVLKQARTPGQR